MTTPPDKNRPSDSREQAVQRISAVTLGVRDLGRSLAFYSAIGFELKCGDADSPLVSFAVGDGYLNLQSAGDEPVAQGWGRVVLYVADVDAMYEHVCRLGCVPEFAPRDAQWGERYFHLRDPDGHELSFARPL